MKEKALAIKVSVALVLLVVLCALAMWAAPAADHPAHPGPWYSIVPPLIAVMAAIITGKILHSLLLAVVVGGLLNTVPAEPTAPMPWVEGFQNAFTFLKVSATDITNLQIIAFVVLVLSTISVMVSAGGLHGIVQRLERYAQGPRSAQCVAYVMGLAVFIDDYANTMIVGSSVRPLTDRYRVSREKLSFIVDCTSAPVAGLALMSTWVGYEVGLFDEVVTSLALDTTGYGILFEALPFRFYCIFILIFVIFNIATGKEYGPMRRAEERARETGELSAEDAVPMTSKTFADAKPSEKAVVHAASAAIPIGVLFAVLLGSIWVAGGGMDAMSERWWAVITWSAWSGVLTEADSIPLLALSAGVALIVASFCAMTLAKLRLVEVGVSAFAGVRSSLLPVSVLILAWSLKGACDSLSTGEFLVATVGDSIPALWFPTITFLIAGATAFCTGTSWGTMAILMPIAAPIAFHLEGDTFGVVSIMCLASILDGAIWGDHCSPISDTTVMTSIACSADHIHHVRTQLPYSMTGALVAVCFGYIPAALGLFSWGCVLLGALALGALFVVLPRRAETATLTNT